jgi:hypothetical protein
VAFGRGEDRFVETGEIRAAWLRWRDEHSDRTADDLLRLPAEQLDRVLVHEGDDTVPVPAQDGTVHALDELAVEICARPPDVVGALLLGDISRADGQASIGEWVRGAVIRELAPYARQLELGDHLLAHRLLRGGQRHLRNHGESEFAEVVAEKLARGHARPPLGGGVDEGDPPAVVDGDEALRAAEHTGEEVLVGLQLTHGLVALEGLRLFMGVRQDRRPPCVAVSLQDCKATASRCVPDDRICSRSIAREPFVD